jgi:hypothetical protein
VLPAALGLIVVVVSANAEGGQDPAQPVGPLVASVGIEGASIYSPEEITTRHHIVTGSRLEQPVESLADAIRKQYKDDGYTLATVTASLDAATGALTIQIEEGRFDAIDVSGVSEDVRRRILDELALRPGEIFNASQANHALDEAIGFAQGAIVRLQPGFTLVSDSGRRVLQIALRTRAHQSGTFAGTQGREDWYSPVDALNAGVGFQSTIFDRAKFNHTYWAGHLTYKFGPDRVGYSLGVERPFLSSAVLQVGASIHDLTTTDDGWRLGDDEQSLVAVTFRNTFRDYYRRKGYQLHAAVRPLGTQEFVIAWRNDEHLSLANKTNYGFFRDEHPFRANRSADEGNLRAVVLGYTYDSRGLARQQAPERYRRHLLDELFGESVERERGVRVDWRSELAPGAFAHDFDFHRHIANARAWWTPSPRRMVSGRIIAGASGGRLPLQRQFSVGGIGSVRGYRFKEATGDRLLLLNGEVRQQFTRRNGLAGLVFLDAGRVYRPHPGSADNWMRGVGVGLEFGDGPRLEFGWRLDDIPRSLQVLFRLRPTF